MRLGSEQCGTVRKPSPPVLHERFLVCAAIEKVDSVKALKVCLGLCRYLAPQGCCCRAHKASRNRQPANQVEATWRGPLGSRQKQDPLCATGSGRAATARGRVFQDPILRAGRQSCSGPSLLDLTLLWHLVKTRLDFVLQARTVFVVGPQELASTSCLGARCRSHSAYRVSARWRCGYRTNVPLAVATRFTEPLAVATRFTKPLGGATRFTQSNSTLRPVNSIHWAQSKD